MKVCVLAGGQGTRLAEETDHKPKPMVEVGGLPILWHIMSIYAAAHYKDFVLALGYKGGMIRDYFLNNHYGRDNINSRQENGNVAVMCGWKVDCVDTGLQTGTGGRLKRLVSQLKDGSFLMTYGDGVADINIDDLVKFHKRSGKLATITAVRPPARFGGLEFRGNLVTKFIEKPQIGEGWINGGFFVLEPQVMDYIEADETMFEREPLERLVKDRQLAAYQHERFWQCMDTLRDVRLLNELWKKGDAPWKTWKG